MIDSKIWAVEQIAAANLGRALGLSLGEEQLVIVAEHLAEHRATAFDLAVSRIRSTILDRIHKVRLEMYARRSAEWSEGCMSAEHAIETMTSAELLEVASPQASSKGQVLRTMIRHAQKSLAANPQRAGPRAG